MFTSHLIKSNHRFLRKNKADTYDFSATVVGAKMCTHYHEDSMYFRFLWNELNCQLFLGVSETIFVNLISSS
jgi:hypothetical protein